MWSLDHEASHVWWNQGCSDEDDRDDTQRDGPTQVTLNSVLQDRTLTTDSIAAIDQNSAVDWTQLI